MNMYVENKDAARRGGNKIKVLAPMEASSMRSMLGAQELAE